MLIQCVYSVFAFAIITFVIAIIMIVMKLKELLGKKPSERLIKIVVVLVIIQMIVGVINLYCALKPSPCVVRYR